MCGFIRHHSGFPTRASRCKYFRRVLWTLPIQCFWTEKPRFYSWGHKSRETLKALNAWESCWWKTRPLLHFTASAVDSSFSWTFQLRSGSPNTSAALAGQWAERGVRTLIKLGRCLMLIGCIGVYQLIPAGWLCLPLILGYWNSAWNQQWQGPCFVSTEVTMTLKPNIVCKLFNAVGQSRQQAHTLHRFLLNLNACRVK